MNQMNGIWRTAYEWTRSHNGNGADEVAEMAF